MSEELKAAQARIACLEGELAKRDEELAACRIAVENCEVFRARIVELDDLVLSLQCKAIERDQLRAMLAAAPAAPAADAGDIVLNASAQEILSQCIGAHAYVLGVLANGRPDLAFIEAKKWVDAFKKAATQMEPSHD